MKNYTILVEMPSLQIHIQTPVQHKKVKHEVCFLWLIKMNKMGILKTL